MSIAAKWLLRALVVANLAALAIFLLVLALSFVDGARWAAMIASHFPGADGAVVVAGIRAILAIGVAMVVPVHLIFVALLRMLATVEAGDPFIADNAARLHRIGWALLAVQLLDVAYGVLLHVAGRDIRLGGGWSFSVAGWISVAMVFVLARVFAQGARMRDELAMTV
ncbi:MAG: DUF2975 domain-containing protein [Sphingomonas sp.]